MTLQSHYAQAQIEILCHSSAGGRTTDDNDNAKHAVTQDLTSVRLGSLADIVERYGATSALPSKADMLIIGIYVCYVPKADENNRGSPDGESGDIYAADTLRPETRSARRDIVAGFPASSTALATSSGTA